MGYYLQDWTNWWHGGSSDGIQSSRIELISGGSDGILSIGLIAGGRFGLIGGGGSDGIPFSRIGLISGVGSDRIPSSGLD